MTNRDEATGTTTGQQRAEDEADGEPFGVNLEVAQPVRLRDALLGGSDNFAVDRDAAKKLTSALPGGAETAQLMLQANSAFRRRAVRYLATETGVRQFLPVGIGVPKGRTTHQIAQELAPGARFVYTIEDPVALAHAHELSRGSDDTVAVIHGGLRDTDYLLAQAGQTLDLSEPVAVVLTTVTFVPDHHDPWSAVAALLAGLSAGSYLVLSQMASDISSDSFAPVGREQKALTSERRMVALTARPRAAVERFFEGLELLEPGLVSVDEWRPDAETPLLPGGLPTPFYAAVGAKH